MVTRISGGCHHDTDSYRGACLMSITMSYAAKDTQLMTSTLLRSWGNQGTSDGQFSYPARLTAVRA